MASVTSKAFSKFRSRRAGLALRGLPPHRSGSRSPTFGPRAGSYLGRLPERNHRKPHANQSDSPRSGVAGENRRAFLVQAPPRAGLEVGVPRVARPQPPRTRGAQYSFRPQALRATSRAPEPVAAANLR